MIDWVQVRQRIFDAFANVEKPDFSSIPILGCCERHEHDFDWYRRHTWQEFEAARESRGFDSADFVAIHPLAFHYFTAGVLCTAIKHLATDAEKYWDDESWIRHYINRHDKFKKEYLPLFSNEQRQVVAEALEWYRQWHLAQHGYDYDDPDDDPDDEETSGKISETIALVWRSET